MPLAQSTTTTWRLRFDLEELMKVGSRVRTVTDLPGIPKGTEGVIAEIGRVFVAVRFADGRTGYYAPRQLAPLTEPDDKNNEEARHSLSFADLGLTGAPVPYGAHLCSLPFTGRPPGQDSVQYLVMGVMRGDCCVAIATPECRDAVCRTLAERGHDPERAREAGELIFLDTAECYYPPDEFTAERQLARMGETLERFVSSGRPLRLLGQVGPSAGLVGTEEWWEYEREVTAHVQRLGAVVFCDYGMFDEYAPFRGRVVSTHQWIVSHGAVRPI